MATTYPPPPDGKCSMIRVYAYEMMKTVTAVPMARKTASDEKSCYGVMISRNAASGP